MDADAEWYLDHAASTPQRSEATAAWLAASATHHANPTGAHKSARAARRALDDARDEVAAALGRNASEIVFTSGGSEADNLAVRGVLAAAGGTAVCSAGEHHAVLDPVRHAGGRTVGLEDDGTVAPDRLAAVLDDTPDVSIVSVITVNNETGVINDIPALVDVTRRHAPGAMFHTDAVQSVRWLDVAEVTAACDLVSVTGHKLGGPVGQGALVIGTDARVEAQILGGGQEQGRRAGTPAVALASAFAAALTCTVRERPEEVSRLTTLRDTLFDGLAAALGDDLMVSAAPAGDRGHLCGGIAHVCLRGIDAEALIFLLDSQGLRASSASSCSSGAQQVSHVLDAMGTPVEWSKGSLRLSLGHTTTEADVEAALEMIPAAVERLRRFDGG